MANGTITIDTDEFIARLTRAKFSRAQAEAAADAIKKDVHVDTGGLATKADLNLAIERLENKIELSEERQTRKSAQQQILTIAILTGVMGVMLVMQGYFLMTLLPSAP